MQRPKFLQNNPNVIRHILTGIGILLALTVIVVQQKQISNQSDTLQLQSKENTESSLRNCRRTDVVNGWILLVLREGQEHNGKGTKREQFLVDLAGQVLPILDCRYSTGDTVITLNKRQTKSYIDVLSEGKLPVICQGIVTTGIKFPKPDEISTRISESQRNVCH